MIQWIIAGVATVAGVAVYRKKKEEQRRLVLTMRNSHGGLRQLIDKGKRYGPVLTHDEAIALAKLYTASERLTVLQVFDDADYDDAIAFRDALVSNKILYQVERRHDDGTLVREENTP